MSCVDLWFHVLFFFCFIINLVFPFSLCVWVLTPFPTFPYSSSNRNGVTCRWQNYCSILKPNNVTYLRSRWLFWHIFTLLGVFLIIISLILARFVWRTKCLVINHDNIPRIDASLTFRITAAFSPAQSEDNMQDHTQRQSSRQAINEEGFISWRFRDKNSVQHPSQVTLMFLDHKYVIRMFFSEHSDVNTQSPRSRNWKLWSSWTRSRILKIMYSSGGQWEHH